MINIGVGKENARDRTVARSVVPRLQFNCAFDLPRQIGRSVDQEPAVNGFRTANRDARLRLWSNFSGARSEAIGAGAIPLGQAAAGGAPENTDANRSTLARSDRARVASALEKNRQSFERRFRPLLFCSFHSVIPIERDKFSIVGHKILRVYCISRAPMKNLKP